MASETTFLVGKSEDEHLKRLKAYQWYVTGGNESNRMNHSPPHKYYVVVRISNMQLQLDWENDASL